MSSLTVVDSGEEAILDAYIAVVNIGGGFSLRLFTNDVTAGLTPTEVDQLTAADFTEASFAGYAAVTFNSGWTSTQGNPTVAVNTLRTFTRTSTGTAQLIRGYYLTSVSGGTLQWFEQFDAPVSIEFINDAISVTPRLTLDDVEGNAMATGTMVMWAVDSAGGPPSGWLLCDGTAVSRSTFADLFAAIGTAYGVGDGSTTFNVPDMRQRFPLGQAASGTGVNVGDDGGAIDHTHGLDTSSSHAKIAPGVGAPGTVRWSHKTVTSWNETRESTNVNTAANTTASTTGVALGGDSDTANPPFLTVNFIIKT